MTVGLVVVSHSAALADGVCELAAQMAPDVRIVAAGGTGEGSLGTSFDLVSSAFEEADSGGGVVVLYDLGSALLTTETALELLDPDAAARVTVVDAPLVEGAVAAAVAAQSGASRESVADAARAAARSWDDAADSPAATAQPAATGTPDATASAVVATPIGIHARPAALIARALNDWRRSAPYRCPQRAAADRSRAPQGRPCRGQRQRRRGLSGGGAGGRAHRHRS